MRIVSGHSGEETDDCYMNGELWHVFQEQAGGYLQISLESLCALNEIFGNLTPGLDKNFTCESKRCDFLPCETKRRSSTFPFAVVRACACARTWGLSRPMPTFKCKPLRPQTVTAARLSPELTRHSGPHPNYGKRTLSDMTQFQISSFKRHQFRSAAAPSSLKLRDSIALVTHTLTCRRHLRSMSRKEIKKIQEQRKELCWQTGSSKRDGEVIRVFLVFHCLNKGKENMIKGRTNKGK